MATVVKMPKWGLTMTAGTVTGWLYQEGAEISEGDPIFTVETEKAVNDVEAPSDGVLLKIIATEGSEVPVSGPVAVIAAPGESLSDDELSALIASAAPAARATAIAASGGVGGRVARAANRDESGRINASPAARRRAQELGIDLANVEATGPDGRITSDDVERAAEAVSGDPAPREERVTLADGRELNVLLAGGGPGAPLIFLHGLGGSQSTWQVVLGELVDGHRVAAIDLPGHGTSDRREGADYTVAGLASAIAEVIEQLKLHQPIVIGHSLGGAVAMNVATTSPSLISGLVLIDSAGLGPEISADLLRLMSSAPGAETARGLLELFYEDHKLVVDRGVQEMAQTQLAEGAWAAQRAVSDAAFGGGSQTGATRADLGAIRVPVQLIWGELDRVIPSEHALAALRAIPDVSLAIMVGVGHVPQVEAAQRTATLIKRFARSLAD
jgi:pyruvate dehydrogenase E2 component (dihydrolipoamide acetyltransferase)